MAKSQGIAPPLITEQAVVTQMHYHAASHTPAVDDTVSLLIPTAQLAHEMKSSLSVILYRAHMLAESSGDLNPTQHRYVTQIIQAGEEMQDTIENMQDLVLGGVGAIILEREQVMPSMLIAAVVAQLAPLAEEKHQRLSATISTDLPIITADRARLQQILVNLITNAIKFTKLGGTINVGAQRGPENAVDFFVRDNGPGIAKKHQVAIFQPFFRVQPTRASGTGLGLALAYQLTQLHHGTIWVESRWHHGSTFWARLPGDTLASNP